MYRFQAEADGAGGSDAVPGSTTIQDSVIGKVIGLSAAGVDGVYALGDGATRVLGALRDAIGSTDHSQGVTVTNVDGVVSVAAVIVVDYPHPVQEVASDVRAAIAHAITVLLGMTAGDIDVTVNDVHVEEGQAEAASHEQKEDARTDAEAAAAGHTGDGRSAAGAHADGSATDEVDGGGAR